MRITIDIDTAKLEAAMSARPYKTKKETVEAGLELTARPANYREILKWQGKLKWEGDDNIDWCAAARSETVPAVAPKPETRVAGGRLQTQTCCSLKSSTSAVSKNLHAVEEFVSNDRPC